MGEEADDVGMSRHLTMQTDLELDLLGSQPTDPECVVFVDELDGDDGLRLVLGHCLADSIANV